MPAGQEHGRGGEGKAALPLQGHDRHRRDQNQQAPLHGAVPELPGARSIHAQELEHHHSRWNDHRNSINSV